MLFIYRNTNPRDIKKQVELRQKLQCKSFKWYVLISFFINLIKRNRFMENVAFDLPQYYPPIPLSPFAQGEVHDYFLISFLFIFKFI